MCDYNAIASSGRGNERAGALRRCQTERFGWYCSNWMLVFSFCVLLSLLACRTLRGDQEEPASEAKPTQGPVWKDAQTGQVLFTIEDVLAFDWDDQIFLLDLDAALDFIAWMVPHMYQTRELLLEDEQGLIYRARWVNMISSMFFQGPVYTSLGWTQFFCIDNGYPGFPVADPDEDTRLSPRLRAALEGRDVLEDFDPEDYGGFRIQRSSTGWYVCGEDLKIRVDYFRDVFWSGQDARVHIFFAGGDQTAPSIDSIAVEIKFVANQGQYRSDVCIDNISPTIISEGIYVCRFQPWTPCRGSVPAVETGGGRISLSVLLCRNTELGPEVFSRLDLPEEAVDVRGPRLPTSNDVTP